MNSTQLARQAYFAMLDKVSEAQQRIVLHEALVARFGTDALPADAMLRSIGALGDAPERIARIVERSKKTIDELTPAIRELERLFTQANDADMESLVEFFSRRHAAKK